MSIPRDFKPRRTPPPLPGPRKIPLLRILLLMGVVFFVWKNRATVESFAFRTLVDIKSASSRLGNPEPIAQPVLDRKDRMILAGGKTFKLANGWQQESWRVQPSSSLDPLLDLYEDPQVRSLIRTLLDFSMDAKGSVVLDLVFSGLSVEPLPRIARVRAGADSRTILWMRQGFYMQVETGCAWNSECPGEPLEGGAVPIGAEFDFEGREHLMTHDLFRGIGESPVVSILPGRVERIQKNPLDGRFLVRIQHPNNQESLLQGLYRVDDSLHVGSHVESGAMLGRLPPLDTAELIFQFKRNGKFMRWDEIRQESRPLADSVFATFQKEVLL